MQPDLILTPFGENADPSTIRTIPETVSPSDPKQNASWSKGFPIATMTAISAGGVPPEGKDLNGVLNAISEHTVFTEGGGQYKWSDEYVAAKGGYAKGAVIQSDAGDFSYVSAVDGNTTNFNNTPSSIGDKWTFYCGQDPKWDALSSPLGSKGVGYERDYLGASIASAGQMFDADSVCVREKRFTDLITDRPDPEDYKTWDWQPAIQAAVNYVYAIAFSSLRVGAIPDISVPGSIYRLKSRVVSYPWIHIRSIGNVTFDFTGAPTSSDGFFINNELNWTNTGTGYSVSGSGSACLNGTNGTILILGAGQETVTGRALVIGNTAGGKDPCRDGRVANVYVRGWQVAVDFQTFSTYLWSFHDCRLENNKYNIRTPVSNTNSGERMEFYNCNLSGSGLTGASIYHRGGSYDIHFVGCSFDFVQDVVLVDGGNYSALNFTDCHFEAWDGYLVNVIAGGGYFSVNIIQSTGYPSHYRDTRPGLNSSGRPLFYANAGCSLQVNLQTSRLSLSQPCFSEGPFVSGGAGDIRVKVSSPTRYAFNYAGSAIDQGVKDWNFQTDAVDTLATALTGWTFDNTSSVTVASSKLVLDGPKKVLQVVGTSDASYCQLTSKDKVPVRPGDLVFSWSAVSRIGLTSGTTNLQCRVVWYDSAGAVLLIPPLWNTVAMKTVFDSDQLPNFSEGNARYIAGEPQPYFAPPGAAFVAFRGLFTSFTGNLLISRASVWVSK